MQRLEENIQSVGKKLLAGNTFIYNYFNPLKTLEHAVKQSVSFVSQNSKAVVGFAILKTGTATADILHCFSSMDGSAYLAQTKLTTTDNTDLFATGCVQPRSLNSTEPCESMLNNGQNLTTLDRCSKDGIHLVFDTFVSNATFLMDCLEDFTSRKCDKADWPVYLLWAIGASLLLSLGLIARFKDEECYSSSRNYATLYQPLLPNEDPDIKVDDQKSELRL